MHPVLGGQQAVAIRQEFDRARGAGRRRPLDSQDLEYLNCWADARHIEGSVADREGRAEGDRCSVRVHVEQAASRTAALGKKIEGWPAHGERKVWRRSRYMHRRSFLHSPVGLPIADGGTKSGSPEARAGDESYPVLRGLRALR